MKLFEIWVDGDEDFKKGRTSFIPIRLGTYRGETFRDACDGFFNEYYGGVDHYDSQKLMYWGKKLRPEQKEVRGIWID